jgi:type II secretory pathway pseudopilin PulG
MAAPIVPGRGLWFRQNLAGPARAPRTPRGGNRRAGRALSPVPSKQGGFTYLAVLLIVAIMGAVLAATATVWHTMSQRDKEADLLFDGHEFRRAIGLYYERTPGAAKQFPKKLEDLLQDKRQVQLSRYLRKIYVDPMTGKKDWGLVKGPGDVIIGVYSRSDETPVKTGNFDEVDKEFEGASTLSDWKFVYEPGKGGPGGAIPAAPPTPGAPGNPAGAGGPGPQGAPGSPGPVAPGTPGATASPTKPPAAEDSASP